MRMRIPLMLLELGTGEEEGGRWWWWEVVVVVVAKM
jgi:hypothetical protein